MQRTALLVSLAALAACQPDAPTEISATDAGKALYEANCLTCHGASGKGDGPAATQLRTPPTDLTKLSAGNGGSFPRAKVMSQVDGYTRTGPHEVMPDFGAGFDGQTVPYDSGDGVLTPTPIELVALSSYVESLQR